MSKPFTSTRFHFDKLSTSDKLNPTAQYKPGNPRLGVLIRAEKPTEAPQSNVLTVTGLLPDDPPAAAEPESPDPASSVAPTSDTALADEVVTHVLRHTRYLLTLKGRPPSRLAGIETYQRLQGVIALTEELLNHRCDPRMARLSQGLRIALLPFTCEYRDLQRGATWLRDIPSALEKREIACVRGEYLG